MAWRAVSDHWLSACAPPSSLAMNKNFTNLPVRAAAARISFRPFFYQVYWCKSALGNSITQDRPMVVAAAQHNSWILVAQSSFRDSSSLSSMSASGIRRISATNGLVFVAQSPCLQISRVYGDTYCIDVSPWTVLNKMGGKDARRVSQSDNLRDNLAFGALNMAYPISPGVDQSQRESGTKAHGRDDCLEISWRSSEGRARGLMAVVRRDARFVSEPE